jgi:hypothetical protein
MLGTAQDSTVEDQPTRAEPAAGVHLCMQSEARSSYSWEHKAFPSDLTQELVACSVARSLRPPPLGANHVRGKGAIKQDNFRPAPVWKQVSLLTWIQCVYNLVLQCQMLGL